MGNLMECIKTRKQPICSVDIGHRSVTPCHLVNISMRLKREIVWDPMKEEIVGDDEANGWLSRQQRPPLHDRVAETMAGVPMFRSTPSRCLETSELGNRSIPLETLRHEPTRN